MRVKRKRKMLNMIILCLVVGFVLDFMRSIDSTDKSRWTRSGLSLYIDHATGVQYVKGGIFGGTTLRVNSDGTPYRGK